MSGRELEEFLTNLEVEENIAASTHKRQCCFYYSFQFPPEIQAW